MKRGKLFIYNESYSSMSEAIDELSRSMNYLHGDVKYTLICEVSHGYVDGVLMPVPLYKALAYEFVEDIEE